MQIQNQSIVSLRYIMKNASGGILEENMNSEPVEYVHGSGRILSSLESSLYGLGAGDKKTVCLKTEETSTDEEFTFEVIIDKVREASGDEILSGEPEKEKVATCGPVCDC